VTALIIFISETTGMTSGNNGTLLRTSNGRTNRGLVYSSAPYFLRYIIFTDNYNGWGFGENGSVIHTYNWIY